MRLLLPTLLLPFLASLLHAENAPAVYSKLLHSTAWVRTTTQGVGTGWVVDEKRRWLITNLHVVGDQDRVEAFFVDERDGQPIAERQYYLESQKRLHEEGRAVRGKVIARREKSDLALIELEKLPRGIVALPLAPSSGPGEHVHSIGNRQDADAIFLHCEGEIRQIGRLTDGYFWRGKKLAAGASCLITQSPIVPGDSGGALVNERSEVVGVLSGLRPAPLASIAIHVSEVRELLAEATKGEKPKAKEETPASSEIYRKLLHATVWVRPTATEGRAAGWIVDRERRLLLTTSSAAGASDLVDVLFPRRTQGNPVAEADAYVDRIGLRQEGKLVRGLVIARDAKRDLALIKLEEMPTSAEQLPLSKVEAKPAERVHVLSHPSGVELLWLYASGSVRQAANIELIASALAEALKPRVLLMQLPHQGSSSGGPVVNERGELIGMLAAKEGAQQQLGYAIAASELFMKSSQAMIAPTTANELYRYGKYLFEHGLHRMALEAFFHALGPRQPLNLSELVRAAIYLGETKAAVAAGKELAALDGESLLFQAYLAWALAENGQLDDAAKRCEQIISKDRKIAIAFLARARSKKVKESIADLDEAIFLDPQQVDFYRARAGAYEQIEDNDKAIADWSRAIELQPYQLDPVRRRAILYLKRNELKHSVADFERLIELQPKEPDNYRGLAKVCLAQGDEPKALHALSSAIRWKPEMLAFISADVLDHGMNLVIRWPDDPTKRPAWYRQALLTIRAVIVDEKVRMKIDAALVVKMDDVIELEKRIRNLER